MKKIIVVALSIGLLASPTLAAQKRTSSERGNAFLKSLVIPGWGQYDSGHKRSAVAFALGELALFGGIYALNSYGVVKRDDYEAYAAQHAGVIGDHSHGFYVDVGNWDRVEDYNEERLRDREFDRLYASRLDQWEWDSYENRVRMKKIRMQSDKAFNAIYFMVGGLILNHIGSAIHAGRISGRPQTHASISREWRFFFAPLANRQGLSFNLNYLF